MNFGNFAGGLSGGLNNGMSLMQQQQAMQMNDARLAEMKRETEMKDALLGITPESLAQARAQADDNSAFEKAQEGFKALQGSQGAPADVFNGYQIKDGALVRPEFNAGAVQVTNADRIAALQRQADIYGRYGQAERAAALSDKAFELHDKQYLRDHDTAFRALQMGDASQMDKLHNSYVKNGLTSSTVRNADGSFTTTMLGKDGKPVGTPETRTPEQALNYAYGLRSTDTSRHVYEYTKEAGYKDRAEKRADNADKRAENDEGRKDKALSANLKRIDAEIRNDNTRTGLAAASSRRAQEEHDLDMGNKRAISKLTEAYRALTPEQQDGAQGDKIRSELNLLRSGTQPDKFAAVYETDAMGNKTPKLYSTRTGKFVEGAVDQDPLGLRGDSAKPGAGAKPGALSDVKPAAKPAKPGAASEYTQAMYGTDLKSGIAKANGGKSLSYMEMQAINRAAEDGDVYAIQAKKRIEGMGKSSLDAVRAVSPDALPPGM